MRYKEPTVPKNGRVLTELFHYLLLFEERGEGRERGGGRVRKILPRDTRAARLPTLVPFQSQQDLERGRKPVLLLGHYPVQLMPAGTPYNRQLTQYARILFEAKFITNESFLLSN